MMNTVCATSCNAMAFVPFPLVSTTPFLSPQVGLPAAAISKRSLLPVKGLNILRQPSSQRARILASAASENPPQKIYKRLTVFSDGTWQSEKNKHPTNVFKLFKAIPHEDKNGIQQIALYDAGIGSGADIGDENWWDKSVRFVDRLAGGGFGLGIDVNIKQLYSFLASNYDAGDEIYLFGYSRGAYTVRSLAGLINRCGLLRRDELSKVHKAYQLYRERKKTSDVVKELQTEPREVPITLIACFDTVGALGIPSVLSTWRLGSKYKFHDTKLSKNVQNAIHVLSVDEERIFFSPTLMDAPKEKLTQLHFPGTHGGVGGGDEEQQGLSNNTLQFMALEMKNRHLSLELDVSNSGSVWLDDPIKKEKNIFGRLRKIFRRPRKIDSIDECHESVVTRYKQVKDWRPRALDPIKAQLEKRIGE